MLEKKSSVGALTNTKLKSRTTFKDEPQVTQVDWTSEAEQAPLAKGIYPGGRCSKLLQVQLPGDYVAGRHGSVSPFFTSVPSAPRAMSGM